MTDLTRAHFVELQEKDGVFVIVLLDEERQQVGHGYKGPTLKRAEQDLRYWTRTKGLQELPAQ
ncbi:MAG TPA: hypothetical protein VF221_08110 [Chloroflexota bacterium]